MTRIDGDIEAINRAYRGVVARRWPRVIERKQSPGCADLVDGFVIVDGPQKRSFWGTDWDEVRWRWFSSVPRAGQMRGQA